MHRIAEVMRRIAPTAQTIVYGSESRGDACQDSDIDLLILLDDSEELTPERELEISRLPYEVEVDTSVIISPIVMLRCMWEGSKTPLSINVMNGGVLI